MCICLREHRVWLRIIVCNLDDLFLRLSIDEDKERDIYKGIEEEEYKLGWL